MPRRKPARGFPWKQWQDDFLREWYGKMSLKDLAIKLKRRKCGVRQRARKLNITISYEARRIATPEEYAKMVTEAAIAAGLKPSSIFSDRRDRVSSSVRQRVWATLRDDGNGLKWIATISGFDHGSVHYGIKRYREMAAQRVVE